MSEVKIDGRRILDVIADLGVFPPDELLVLMVNGVMSSVESISYSFTMKTGVDRFVIDTIWGSNRPTVIERQKLQNMLTALSSMGNHLIHVHGSNYIGLSASFIRVNDF